MRILVLFIVFIFIKCTEDKPHSTVYARDNQDTKHTEAEGTNTNSDNNNPTPPLDSIETSHGIDIEKDADRALTRPSGHFDELPKVESPIQNLALADGLNMIFIHRGNNTSGRDHNIVNLGYGRFNLHKERSKFFSETIKEDDHERYPPSIEMKDKASSCSTLEKHKSPINPSDYSLVIGIRAAKYRIYGIKSVRNGKLNKSMIKNFGSPMMDTSVGDEDLFCLDSLSEYPSMMISCEPSGSRVEI